jgi:hypothetical protein
MLAPLTKMQPTPTPEEGLFRRGTNDAGIIFEMQPTSTPAAESPVYAFFVLPATAIVMQYNPYQIRWQEP